MSWSAGAPENRPVLNRREEHESSAPPNSRCSTSSGILLLPTELLLEIFSNLDQIDSCALGLSSNFLYGIYRALHGIKMPLSTRRLGPNSLESAWQIAGFMCGQCGIQRCELYQHIKSWMPPDLEYCAMKRTFGIRSQSELYATCYRNRPRTPSWCGRHPLRTMVISQANLSGDHF
ncbi:BgTH12-00646 [Blumeria graminis f. sp. triticale]|uniref:Bgt-3100 n=3 Tax=Blumeria graminis TaxID=34373 RepID=A0A381L911_BLUGR|nr:hypothetical protein BGT96224_3100 [Blumeria graminis f. sp. tritici 96224]CAD6505151.1 BgTH12-00646 [Blumeria graminis f. sp. triticale]VDB93153.1 Bgt-3100 [Blumeria graminis f. sp. tritici]